MHLAATDGAEWQKSHFKELKDQEHVKKQCSSSQKHNIIYVKHNNVTTTPLEGRKK